MNVKGIVWMGVQTERYAEMATFLRALIGEPPPADEPGFSRWSLPNGDLVELFAEGHKESFGRAPVVGFRVTDLEQSRRDLEEAGGVVVGGYGPNESGYASVHFRAPDGNVYEIVHDPDHEIRGKGS